MWGNTVAVGGAVLVLGVAGCGGGGSTRLARAQFGRFARQGNALCVRARNQALSANKDTPGRLVEFQNALLADMQRLVPPPQLQGQMAAYTRIVRAVGAEYKLAAEAARPTKALEQRTRKLIVRLRAMAAALGLTSCGPIG
jgi:hypothetical protein